MAAMFSRRGRGGRVLTGYQTAARVSQWEYAPEPEHGQAAPGAGLVNVTLDDVDPVWLTGDRFDLELREGPSVLRWDDVEMLSEACFVVGQAPAVRRG